jgi:hypothetical protein
MGRAILHPDVRLDFDDPGRAPARGVVTDQAGAEQRPRDLEGGASQR